MSKAKQKTLVIAKDYRTFCNFISATGSDRADFVYIQALEMLHGYDRDIPLLKIEGYNVVDFPPNSHIMLRMRNQHEWSFESIVPKGIRTILF